MVAVAYREHDKYGGSMIRSIVLYHGVAIF